MHGPAALGPTVIYIPFQNLDGTFEKPDAEIVLPYLEYQKLLQAWKESQKPRTAPEVVITRSEYAVTVEEDLARIKVTLKINVLGKAWTAAPVRFGDAAVGQVTGDDVLIRGTGDGSYELLFPEAGEKQVELELAARIKQTPDGREFSFAVPPVAMTTLDVTVPRRNQEVVIQPRLVTLPIEPMEEDADSTRIRASLGSTDKISVRWHPKASLKPEMQLLASVTNHTRVNVEDGLIHTDAFLTYEVLRGSLEQVRVVVPGNHRILDVTADARVKSWKAEKQGENQIVEIELLSAVEAKVVVEIHTERKLAEEQFDLAGIAEDGTALGIHALDAVRESGQIAVRHGADLTLTVVEQQGLVRIEAAEVAQPLKGNNAFTYKFYSTDLKLRMTARPVEPRVTVAHQAQFVFEEDELQFSNQFQYTIERAGVFELVLQLPEGITVDDVQSPRMKEFNLHAETRRLTVSLNERTQGNVPLSIRGHRDLAESLTLPIIEPLQVERETGTILVFAREAIEVITDQAGLVSAQPLPVGNIPRPAFARGAVSLQSAWSFSRRPVTIPVRTVRKPTRLSTRIATTIDVQPELTQVRTLLDFQIEYSETDTFRLEVPEAVSERIQIELEAGDSASSPIKQRTAGEAQEGWITWTVVTQRPVLGRQRFVVTYDLREERAAGHGQENDAAAPPQRIDVLRTLGLVNDANEIVTPVTRIQGEIAVEKERSLSVTATASGGGVEAIDLRELTLLPTDGTAAFRYFKDDPTDRVSVLISRTRHAIQEVVATVVSRSLVEVVIGEDGDATYRARFLVKTTERQRLLMLLPVNLEVLGAFLDDREIKLEKADVAGQNVPNGLLTPFWVNVARPGSSDEPFLLTVQFLWTVAPALGESDYARGKMNLPLPQLGEGSDSVTQELRTVVWMPKEYALVGDPSRFQLQKRPRPLSFLLGEQADVRTDHLDNWVRALPGGAARGVVAPAGFAQFPTEGRVPYIYHNLGGARQIRVTWWHRLTMTVFLSLAIVLVGWILIGTSWENKLGILLLAAFVLTLYGMNDSHALAHGLSAARFGIAVLLGLWLIHGLFGWTRKAHEPPSRTYHPTRVPAVIPPPGVFDHLQSDKSSSAV